MKNIFSLKILLCLSYFLGTEYYHLNKGGSPGFPCGLHWCDGRYLISLARRLEEWTHQSALRDMGGRATGFLWCLAGVGWLLSQNFLSCLAASLYWESIFCWDFCLHLLMFLGCQLLSSECGIHEVKGKPGEFASVSLLNSQCPSLLLTFRVFLCLLYIECAGFSVVFSGRMGQGISILLEVSFHWFLRRKNGIWKLPEFIWTQIGDLPGSSICWVLLHLNHPQSLCSHPEGSACNCFMQWQILDFIWRILSSPCWTENHTILIPVSPSKEFSQEKS